MDKYYEFILSFGVSGLRAVCTQDPVWERIVAGVKSVFNDGGRATLTLHGSEGTVRSVVMEGIKGAYRILLRLNSDDPRNEILQWWDESGGDKDFNLVTYLDQQWDVRGWLTDAELAENVMREFFDHGVLEIDERFKSLWDLDFSFKS
ncbi:DUF6911 family protein [Xanthomonas campestris]|uniref:DUF6911 family protein n=1 Tax=Xanthomonas campestris TaxID=339 RepID=UPI00114CA949|nr:hypothetical protein [Xanthomonas campestris]MEB1150581.1 hypothetical protein [Xanthomonas campestris pv. campestris]MCC5097209.1 hypothetical protein [Xanthomonas campestris]MEA9583125.1 hypothetical protein [Xanthomonas campestris]MEA9591420.1 hypothetical protein [Xanthomonas campestris]MEA9623021.1 hypothetical protein [Xanthomonas campestris]